MNASQVVMFLVTLGLGCLLGVYGRALVTKIKKPVSQDENVKHRLQLFLDSYSDDALDQFIRSLELTPETLPLHISIGKHFRTQGEVDRAIFMHQNLMAHPELSDKLSERVVYELAKDYQAAGLYDRAEALFKQLLNSKSYGLKSRKLLLNIFEREQDWQDAIGAASAIDLKRHPEFRVRLAQYHCELAEMHRQSRAVLDARQQLLHALSIDKACVRAYLELAKLERDQANYRQAIHYLRELVALSPADISLALPLFFECSRESDSFDQYQTYLQKVYQQTAQIQIVLAIVQVMQAQGHIQEADEYLSAKLSQAPSMPVLNALLQGRKAASHGVEASPLLALVTELAFKVQKDKAAYQCVQCGFSGQQLHWMCPSCKNWQSIKPVVEYETTA